MIGSQVGQCPSTSSYNSILRPSKGGWGKVYLFLPSSCIFPFATLYHKWLYSTNDRKGTHLHSQGVQKNEACVNQKYYSLYRTVFMNSWSLLTPTSYLSGCDYYFNAPSHFINSKDKCRQHFRLLTSLYITFKWETHWLNTLG